ncbi:TetR family transcriptional regulator, partial [Actinotalea fermentans ATCC 43279 = JCM 9966 = DSM 3133]
MTASDTDAAPDETSVGTPPDAPATGARARTRRAILDAAVSVFSSNQAASLGEVAQAAQVGRSTLHRYFPERADLMRAVGAEAL